MRWASVDPANKSGVAIWKDDKLIKTGVIHPRGTKGKYYNFDGSVADKKLLAWEHFILDIDALIIEEGFGGFAKAVSKQAELRGYIKAICDATIVPVTVVNVSEWRRCIKEDLDISWPKSRERKKELSIKLVNNLYGISVSDDEADAVLLGHAAIRMRLNRKD